MRGVVRLLSPPSTFSTRQVSLELPQLPILESILSSSLIWYKFFAYLIIVGILNPSGYIVAAGSLLSEGS